MFSCIICSIYYAVYPQFYTSNPWGVMQNYCRLQRTVDCAAGLALAAVAVAVGREMASRSSEHAR